MKPGYKTTEFWLTVIASVGSLLIASGALIEGSALASIVATIVSGLATLGYSAGRVAQKTGE